MLTLQHLAASNADERAALVVVLERKGLIAQTEAQERRVVPRANVTGRSVARVQGMREVRLRDLSLAGAQIEHLDLLRLDARYELDLPPPLGT